MFPQQIDSARRAYEMLWRLSKYFLKRFGDVVNYCAQAAVLGGETPPQAKDKLL